MATVTVRFDDDGYVDANWALEAARQIDAVMPDDPDQVTQELVDWLIEGDFRDGETVEIEALVAEWRAYQSQATNA